MNFTELIQAVIEWGNNRDLIHRNNAPFQMMKVTEEIGELAAALSRNKEAELRDAIGDSFVTLIILAAQTGHDPTQCLKEAYAEIAGRKGQTVNGTFIKDE
jgi:NTP pyrophosphatase (non-canonical NTP hydrolase)